MIVDDIKEAEITTAKYTVVPDEIKRLKGLGCLHDKRNADTFNVRTITCNGKITSQQMDAVSQAAKKFGNGEVAVTTRLTLEIQCVKYENLEPLFEFLKNNGLETGGTGAKVRPIVSCKGSSCQYGLCDTYELSERLHEAFYIGKHSVVLPHKFKIAVGGCPNNCVKPNLNDVGIIGQRTPKLNLELCRGCKVCQVENACPMKASKVTDGKIKIDINICNSCGRCVGKCPFHVTDHCESGYKIYIGGRWGKNISIGQPFNKLLHSEDEVIELINIIINFYRDNGKVGERFADTVDRLGFDAVQESLNME